MVFGVCIYIYIPASSLVCLFWDPKPKTWFVVSGALSITGGLKFNLMLLASNLASLAHWSFDAPWPIPCWRCAHPHPALHLHRACMCVPACPGHLVLSFPLVLLIQVGRPYTYRIPIMSHGFNFWARPPHHHESEEWRPSFQRSTISKNLSFCNAKLLFANLWALPRARLDWHARLFLATLLRPHLRGTAGENSHPVYL